MTSFAADDAIFGKNSYFCEINSFEYCMALVFSLSILFSFRLLLTCIFCIYFVSSINNVIQSSFIFIHYIFLV